MSVDSEDLSGTEDEEETSGDEEEEQPHEGHDDDEVVNAGIYNSREVNDKVFEELILPPDVVNEVQFAWTELLTAMGSREAVGEAMYSALFDAAPSLQALFKTPRAVMALRFMNGINQIVVALNDPKGMKVIVETLGFQHLDLEVTVPRVSIFRDAILELVATEVGPRCSTRGREGFATVLNYVGGAYIYVRDKFADKLKVLHASWAMASRRPSHEADDDEDEGTGEGTDGTPPPPPASSRKTSSRLFRSNAETRTTKSYAKSRAEAAEESRNNLVPQTFDDMFVFNAAVMGFGQNGWMHEVLLSFDTIVTNVANSYRLQEECDVLSLRMSKFKNVNLSEFKAVMLASLRSLCKDWGSNHEIAWSWLWENVERMLKALQGKAASQEKALTRMFNALDESSLAIIRRDVYARFFALAPAGQDYFKQSTTRLHFIADKVVAYTQEMYREPKKMVEDISALGLRHVGYGIPTDLFGPFVTACVQVVQSLAKDEAAEEAFRWSLNLVTRILTRVINEGSTVVMKAINANSDRQLRRAVACAPRGARAMWMLNVQVGTQSISPLLWALETGSLDAAQAIILDLLTIRADRDRYYYGMDPLFERHPDILKRMSLDAPNLLPVLLDGLIWRSRTTEGGQRRVVYYCKHLLVDLEGKFSQNLEWLMDHGDPKLVCHPIVTHVTDLVWRKLAFRAFLQSRSWFLVTLAIFVCAQSIFNRLDKEEGGDGDDDDHHQDPQDVLLAIFIARCFIYAFSLGSWLIHHTVKSIRDFRRKNLIQVGCFRVPEYLSTWQSICSLCLLIFLLLMLCMEPIFHCLGDPTAANFAHHCSASEGLTQSYSVLSTIAILLYFTLLVDLSVFSTRISAFALVCSRVIAEVLLCGVGLLFAIVSFSCAISSLEQEDPDFEGIPKSAASLLKITLGMFSGDHLDAVMEQPPALLVCICLYSMIAIIFLLNLLVAQLNCAYAQTYQDMMGFARLNRMRIVVNTMPSVAEARWEHFVESLCLDERIEFGEGDIGLPGGICITEPASLNLITVDLIKRYGGSTSAEEQWPEDPTGEDEDDKFERLEKLITKSMKRLMTSQKGGNNGSVSGSLMHESESGSQMQSGTS